jgi:hypothetical protein
VRESAQLYRSKQLDMHGSHDRQHARLSLRHKQGLARTHSGEQYDSYTSRCSSICLRVAPCSLLRCCLALLHMQTAMHVPELSVPQIEIVPSQLIVGPTSLTVSDNRSVKAVVQWICVRVLGRVTLIHAGIMQHI